MDSSAKPIDVEANVEAAPKAGMGRKIGKIALIGVPAAALLYGAISWACSSSKPTPEGLDLTEKPKHYVTQKICLPDKSNVSYQFESDETGYSHAWETYKGILAEERACVEGDKEKKMTFVSLAVVRGADIADGLEDGKVQNDGINKIVSATGLQGKMRVDKSAQTPLVEGVQKEYEARIEAAKGQYQKQ